MQRAVGCALREDQASQLLRIEFVDRGSGELGERDFDLCPAGGGKIAGDGLQVQACGEFAVGIGDSKNRQRGCGNSFRRVASEIEIRTKEADFAIAKAHDVDARVPSAVFGGFPFEMERVRRG